MIELRFHRELYDGNALDEAMQVFGAHATFERAEEPAHWIVRVTGLDPSREKRIAGELANYALGLTIGSRGGSSASPASSSSSSRVQSAAATPSREAP